MEVPSSRGTATAAGPPPPSGAGVRAPPPPAPAVRPPPGGNSMFAGRRTTAPSPAGASPPGSGPCRRARRIAPAMTPASRFSPRPGRQIPAEAGFVTSSGSAPWPSSTPTSGTSCGVGRRWSAPAGRPAAAPRNPRRRVRPDGQAAAAFVAADADRPRHADELPSRAGVADGGVLRQGRRGEE